MKIIKRSQKLVLVQIVKHLPLLRHLNHHNSNRWWIWFCRVFPLLAISHASLGDNEMLRHHFHSSSFVSWVNSREIYYCFQSTATLFDCLLIACVQNFNVNSVPGFNPQQHGCENPAGEKDATHYFLLSHWMDWWRRLTILCCLSSVSRLYSSSSQLQGGWWKEGGPSETGPTGSHRAGKFSMGNDDILLELRLWLLSRGLRWCCGTLRWLIVVLGGCTWADKDTFTGP